MIIPVNIPAAPKFPIGNIHPGAVILSAPSTPALIALFITPSMFSGTVIIKKPANDSTPPLIPSSLYDFAKLYPIPYTA
ncbi:hypothetical protein D3C73_917930 [compost metagenome]